MGANEWHRTECSGRCFAGLVGVRVMAGDLGSEADGLVARVSEAFQRNVFQPMFLKAPHAPAEVRRLIAELRRQLDLLDAVIATAGGAGAAANGTAHASVRPPTSAADADESDEADELGRNQRSRIRELHLLDAMARETRPYSLQQLLSALERKGFGDSSGAVVSQLHRLKKLALINQPAAGMYEITTDGLGHLRKLKASFGALVADGR